jgi:hypothetical protein
LWEVEWRWFRSDWRWEMLEIIMFSISVTTSFLNPLFNTSLKTGA